MKILIVDDDEDARMLLKKTLESRGYIVETAENGQQALEAIRLLLPDMIISDILMPVMDGFQLCRKVKTDRDIQHIPFVVYTATYIDPKDEELGLKMGAEKYIIKPKEPEAFIEIITEVINDARAGKADIPLPAEEDEKEILKLYNQRLIKRIEKKMFELEEEVVHRRKVENDLRESQKELQILNRIAEIFLSLPDETVYKEVLNAILEATQSRFGIFGYIDDKGDWVCPSLTREVWDQCRVSGKDITFSHKTWTGIWGKAMVEKKTLYSNEPFRVPKGHISITRALDTPVIHKKELIGNLLVGNKETDYEEKDKEFLKNLVDYIAPVLHARLQRDRKEKEKKKLEDQLLQAQKMEAIGTLAGGIAHDFNNLLTTIIGYSEFALDELRKDTPLYDNIEEILQAGRRAATLTRQLLAFSRKQVIQPETLNLNDILKKTKKMLRRIIGEDIHLEADFLPGLWNIKADPGQMDQILINLSVNARDAMSNGGKLTIETSNVDLDETYFQEHGVESNPGPYVMLAVTDAGKGMSEETRNRIFEPFYTTKGLGKGTGLGLSTVYGIVKQNRGHIWVYSEPGMGSTFKVYFPAVMTDVETLEKETSKAHLKGSETILVVEDDDMLRRMIVKIFETNGYSVISARNGSDALKIPDEYEDPIHLLLTDMVMPGMSGQDLVAQIKLKRPEIRVVCMTGYADMSVFDTSVLDTDVSLISKPFTPEDLLVRIREVLNRGLTI